MSLDWLSDLQPTHPAVFIGLMFAGSLLLWLIKRVILVRLRAKPGENARYTKVVANALERPLSLLILLGNLLALRYLLAYLDMLSDGIEMALMITIKVGLIICVLLFIERLMTGLLTKWSDSSDWLRTSSSITRGALRVIVLTLGGLVILSTLGVSITPLIASLGITSLAVALALQPTLENFFSGVQLVADKPFRVGDFIELDSGEQGFVEKIGWRSTWIKMLPNNVVIMPNSLLSHSKVINYFYPEKELSVPVEVCVHYNSDLEQVERVTLEVARHILKTHKWGVPEYETFVVFHTFDSSSINFTVMLRTREYFNRFFIKSEFIKALHQRYAEEGIVIPYPIRAINTSQESPQSNIPVRAVADDG